LATSWGRFHAIYNSANQVLPKIFRFLESTLLSYNNSQLA
jgi:hypothetical protein